MGTDPRFASDDELKAEYENLRQAGWARSLAIAKQRKERHEKINFTNPLFLGRLKELEQEIKNRGL